MLYSFYAIFIPSRHFVKAVSSQPDRGDLSAIDGAVEVIFFDFDGTLTESHRHDFCPVPGLSPNKGHSRNDRSQSAALTIKWWLIQCVSKSPTKMNLFEASASHVNH